MSRSEGFLLFDTHLFGHIAALGGAVLFAASLGLLFCLFVQ